MDQYPCYNNPPIKEALCEFHFKPKRNWDLTLPGKLQSALGQEYTGKPHEQRVVWRESFRRPASQFEIRRAVVKDSSYAQNGTRMIGVGPDVLSVHLLDPYSKSSNLLSKCWRDRVARGFCRDGNIAR